MWQTEPTMSRIAFQVQLAPVDGFLSRLQVRRMFNELFAYKAWANQEILAAMAAIADENRELRHLAIRVLNHTFVVDRIFASHLAGETHHYAATNTSSTPTMDELRSSVTKSDEWYRGFVANLDHDSLNFVVEFTFTDGAAGSLSRRCMLMHVVNHGTYHRGAIGRLIADAGGVPPADTLTRYLRLSGN